MHRSRLAWSPELLTYDFGPGHPMAPARLDLTIRLITAIGLMELPTLDVIDAPAASDQLLRTVHDAGYVEAVHCASSYGKSDLARGLGFDDNPIFPAMHRAASRQVGGSVALAESIWQGFIHHGVNIAGGMHHAQRNAASGFCIYNDAAAAIKRFLDLGAERVAYIDLDAHHGDGVEAIFWEDPRVMTLSIHEDGRILFPGTGFSNDVGGSGAALGTAVNIPVPPHTDSAQWLRAVDAVILPVTREFQPDVVVSQHGCDCHGNDPLTHLDVGISAQNMAAQWVHKLSHDLADGRWLALGGGGYAVVDVVPLVWTLLVATVAHQPLTRGMPLPHEWRAAAHEMSQIEPALTLGSDQPVTWHPWQDGWNPDDPVDHAIAATRQAVFPLHGLEPLHG